jgi:hypothetical protein
MEERRRAPRYDVPAGELVFLPHSVTVQVLDISVDGILLQADRMLDVGARGALRLTMGGMPVSADVEVRRVFRSPTRNGTYGIGVSFVTITPEHRRVIERFMHQ